MKKLIILYVVIIIFQTVIYFKYYPSTFPYDDAYITFRYSENLANGEGWVYNTGEFTSGTTSFFNTILILFFEKISNQTAESIGRMLPIVISYVNFFILIFLLYRLTFSKTIVVIFMMLYFFNPYIYSAAFSGMETNLFIFFTLVIFLLFYYDKILMTCLISVLLPFIRPEGFLILVLISIFILIKRKNYKHWIIYLTILSLSFIIYPLINCIYFGIPIPLSVIANYITYENTDFVQSRYQLIKEFFFDKWAPIFIPLVCLGFIYTVKFRIKVTYIFLFTFSYIFIFFIFNPWMRPWYYFVVHPFIIFLSSFGLLFLFKLIKESHVYSGLSAVNKNLIQVSSFILFVFYFVITFYSEFFHNIENNGKRSGFNKSVIEIGNYLFNIDNIRRKKIYTADIGYIGYVTKARIIDYAGLVYPKSLEYSKYKSDYKEGKYLDWSKQIEFLKEENPDFIVNDNVYPFYTEMKKDKFILQNYSSVFSSGTMEVLKKMSNE